MIDLLSELDHGPSALPKGSEVTMFNTRTDQEVLGMPILGILQGCPLQPDLLVLLHLAFLYRVACLLLSVSLLCSPARFHTVTLK